MSSTLALCLVWGWYVETTPAEQAALIERLGSPRFVLREEASQCIREHAGHFQPLLRKASYSEDAEVRRRALELLREEEVRRENLYKVSPRWPGWNW